MGLIWNIFLIQQYLSHWWDSKLRPGLSKHLALLSLKVPIFSSRPFTHLTEIWRPAFQSTTILVLKHPGAKYVETASEFLMTFGFGLKCYFYVSRKTWWFLNLWRWSRKVKQKAWNIASSSQLETPIRTSSFDARWDVFCVKCIR